MRSATDTGVLRHWPRAARALTAVLALLAVLPATAAAAPPANDNLANATLIPPALPASVTGTNVDATLETDEPDHTYLPGGASVWWTWTPAASGTVTIDLCDSDFDTQLAVYTGTAVTALTFFASSEDACGLQSQLSFLATAGTEYKIVVDGFFGDAGAIDMNLAALAAPANDNFANATPITGFPTLGSNVGASAEAGEPDHEGLPGGASVWWIWTPGASGNATLETCESSFLTATGVYTGTSPAALTDVVVDSELCDDPASLGSVLHFPVTSGTPYHIAVDGLTGEAGDISFTAAIAPPPPRRRPHHHRHRHHRHHLRHHRLRRPHHLHHHRRRHRHRRHHRRRRHRRRCRHPCRCRPRPRRRHLRPSWHRLRRSCPRRRWLPRGPAASR